MFAVIANTTTLLSSLNSVKNFQLRRFLTLTVLAYFSIKPTLDCYRFNRKITN